jgi:hypothetical protein
MQLASFEILGDVDLINTQLDHYRAVTADQIRLVAEKILRPGNKNTLNYLSLTK